MFEAKNNIGIEDFTTFKQKLRLALRHFEFHQYEVIEGKETISIEEFAKSLMVCLPQHQAALYFKRINSLNLEGEVTFNEFIAFQNFIDDVQTIKAKVAIYKHITQDQLK